MSHLGYYVGTSNEVHHLSCLQENSGEVSVPPPRAVTLPPCSRDNRLVGPSGAGPPPRVYRHGRWHSTAALRRRALPSAFQGLHALAHPTGQQDGRSPCPALLCRGLVDQPFE